MTTKKRVLPAVLFSLFAGVGAPGANGAQFSGVYVFGDSLSDAGYYRPFLASLGLPPPVVAALGRFTTNPGPVWSELVAQYYGVTPAPSNANGTIYAQGGATVASPSPSTPPGGAQRPVSTQIGEYLASHGNAADPGALYSVWAGANDIFNNLGALQAGAISAAQLQTNVLGAAAAEIAQIGRLQAAGARYILVFGLPDIGATPAFAAAGAAVAGSVTQLSAGYNTTLFSGLAARGMRVIPVDTFSLLSEVRANPAAYGFSNVTRPACGPFPPITTSANSQFCLPTNLVAPNAAQTYLFADGVHPTTASHAIVAQFVEALIEGPTAYSLLAEVPLRTRTAHVRSLAAGFAAAQPAEVGRLVAFAAAGGGNFDVDSVPVNAGLGSRNRAYTIGVAARASESFTIGLALGKSTSDATFGQQMGGFSTDELQYTLFGGAHVGAFYFNAAGTISNIDFNDVQRNIALGSALRTATASPKGSNASMFVNAGYDFTCRNFTFGPTLVFAAQTVDINSFDESGAGSANLHFADQKRRSEVWGVGARASLTLGGWTPYARITADRERKNDQRFVTASPLSLATGNSYDIPAYMPGSNFVTSLVGVNGTLTDKIALGLAYYRISGRSGVKEDGVSGSVVVRF